MNLQDPTEVALATIDLLARNRIRHALYGGLALAAYGEPRETRDVDLAVVESRAEEVIRSLSYAGWAVQLAFESLTFGGLHLSRITLLDLDCHSVVRGAELNVVGELIEDYPTAHRALPDCLVLGALDAGDAIHAVVAIDERRGRILVVTVYRPEPTRWTNDFKQRL